MSDISGSVQSAPGRPTDRTHPVQRWKNDQLCEGLETVAEEVPVALVYNGISHAVMLATPANLADFGIGFSLTEGIVENKREVYNLEVSDQCNGIEVHMTIASERMFRLKERRRNLTGRTGCGLCGTESLQELTRQPAHVSSRLSVSQETLHIALAGLAAHQKLFQATGVVHAAAWADLRGNVRIIREDVGRHNALDKLVGAMSVQEVDPETGLAVVTSRASYEMVMKAASAGVSLLAAISAPTGLAVQLAEEAGLTLVGFARNRNHVAYTNAQRIHPHHAVQSPQSIKESML